eukprot:jgi/Galph1/1086/GphlegSOOS_G5781.1
MPKKKRRQKVTSNTQSSKRSKSTNTKGIYRFWEDSFLTASTKEEFDEVCGLDEFESIPAPLLKRKSKEVVVEQVAPQETVPVPEVEDSQENIRKKYEVERFIKETDLSNISSISILAARFTRKLIHRITMEGLLNFQCEYQSLSDELKNHILESCYNKPVHTQNETVSFSSEKTIKQPPLSNGRGNAMNHGNSKNLTCTQCGVHVAASRYAAHLEKCLGKGGRLSSRAASLRLRTSIAENAQGIGEQSPS